MKILIQWTRANPRGWEQIDSTQWRGLAKRPDPTGTGPGGVDDEPGWVFGLGLQGTYFTADHYAVEPLPGRGCRVTTWNDDPHYAANETRNGQVRTFLPLVPDPMFGGRWNTRQSVTFYDEPGVQRIGVDPASIRPWAEFPMPDEAITLHGKLVPDALNVAHDQLRTPPGWRLWTEGVPRGAIVQRGESYIVAHHARDLSVVTPETIRAMPGEQREKLLTHVAREALRGPSPDTDQAWRILGWLNG